MQEQEHEFSFKSLFVPFTTFKAVQWILVIGLVVYFNSLFNGFVADDLPQIVNDPRVHSIFNLFTYFQGGTYFASSQDALSGIYYKPLMLSVFALITTIFGLNAFYFHLVQLTLHITNSLLLFFVLKHFFKKQISFFLSVIFLIHPLNSEAVLYISAMQENLFFLFGILSFLLLLKKSENKITQLLIPVFLLLSMFSKETGVLFLFIDILFFGIFVHKNKLLKIGILASSFVVYLLLRLPAVGIKFNNTKASPIMAADFWHRLISIPLLFNFYIVKVLYPKELLMSYNIVLKEVSFTNFYLPLLISTLFLSIVTLEWFYLWKLKSKSLLLYIFFFLWFVAGIGMHLQIVPLDQSAAERWFYFPMVGLLGMAGVFIESLSVKKEIIKKILLGIVILFVVIFSLRTIARGFDWKNGLTLYKHDLQNNQNDFLLNGDLGYELYQIGDLKGSKNELYKSITSFPVATNYNNYCLLQYIIGTNDNSNSEKLEGISCYKNMLTQFDYQPAIYEKLIDLYIRQNDLSSAESFAKVALERYPQRATYWFYLAEIDIFRKNKEQALSYIEKAYKLDPQNAGINKLYNQLLGGY